MNRWQRLVRRLRLHRYLWERTLRGGLVNIQVMFDAFDCWVGVFVDRDHPDMTIVVCPVPMLAIRLVLVSPREARDRKRRKDKLMAELGKQSADWMPAYVAQLVKQHIDTPLPRRRGITGISGFDTTLPGDFKSKVPGYLSNVVVVKKNES